jgi:hypothetical protein
MCLRLGATLQIPIHEEFTLVSARFSLCGDDQHICLIACSIDFQLGIEIDSLCESFSDWHLNPQIYPLFIATRAVWHYGGRRRGTFNLELFSPSSWVHYWPLGGHLAMQRNIGHLPRTCLVIKGFREDSTCGNDSLLFHCMLFPVCLSILPPLIWRMGFILIK